MRRIYLLAALVAPLLANSALAAQALAVSGSAACSRSYAVVNNAANREEAKRRALAECRDVSGRNDCQVILENDSRGYGALYAAIASDRECYVSALTGFANRNAAHDATLADCKKYYGVSSCTPLNDWRETGASNSPSVVRAEGSAAVAKAAPVPNAQQVASLQKSQTKNERSDAGAQSSEKASAPNNAVPGSDLKPNWTLFTNVHIDGASIYVDKNTIDKDGKVVKFRVLTNNYEEQKTKSGHPFRSTVRHWEFACSSHNVRYTKYEVYSGNMGHGEKMFADPQDQFLPYEPDSATIAGALHNFACGTPGNYRHTSRDSEPNLFWHCDHRKGGAIISEDEIRTHFINRSSLRIRIIENAR